MSYNIMAFMWTTFTTQLLIEKIIALKMKIYSVNGDNYL
jgi:hypothetical protein